jgi:hypothetical protein
VRSSCIDRVSRVEGGRENVAQLGYFGDGGVPIGSAIQGAQFVNHPSRVQGRCVGDSVLANRGTLAWITAHHDDRR